MQTLPQETQFQSNYPIAINAGKFNQFLDLCKNLADTWELQISLYTWQRGKLGTFAVCHTRYGTIRAKISDQYLDIKNATFCLKHFPKLTKDFTLAWDEKNLFVGTIAGTALVPLIENQFVNYGHIEESQEYNPKPICTYALLESLPAMLKIVQESSIRNYGSVVHVESAMDCVKFIGTDGFRLAYYDFNNSLLSSLNGVSLNYSTVRFLAKLAKISKKEKQEISVNCSEDKTTFFVACGDIVAKFLTSSVRYPQYKSILPNRQGYTYTNIRDVKNKAKELKPLLKLAGKHKVARFIGETVDSIENRIEAFGEEFNSVGTINFNHGARQLIRFNGKFFLDCLETMPHEDFCLYTKNSDDPMILESGSLTFLLVPVRHDEKK